MTEEYLWKYISLDKFVSLLKNHGLYFSTVQHLKTNIDPEECLIIDSYTNNQIVSIQSTLKDCFLDDIKQKFKQHIKDFEIIRENVIKNIFVCSFTNDSVENYALWKIYPTDLNGTVQINQGLAIRFKKNHLINLFKQPKFVMNNGITIDKYRVFLRKMQYASKADIVERAKILLDNKSCYEFYELLHSLKLDFYKYEQEERAVIQMFDENKQNCLGGFLKIKLNELFDDETKIFISPFAQNSLEGYIKYLLKEYKLNPDILINNSKIVLN